jgi:hypothetical protein
MFEMADLFIQRFGDIIASIIKKNKISKESKIFNTLI